MQGRPVAADLGGVRALFFVVLVSSACLPTPQLDAKGPKLLRFELEGRGQDLAGRRVSVRPRIELSFDGPLDPASVHAGTLSLRPMEGDDPCSALGVCEEGRCVGGLCLGSSLSEGEVDDLLDGDYGPAVETGPPLEAQLELHLLDGPGGSRSRLRIEPRRALWGDARYELVLGGLRDPAGNPLHRWFEEGTPHRFEFSTRKVASAGPEARLEAPPAGARELPTNLAQVQLGYLQAVDLSPESLAEASASLESDTGEVVLLEDPQPCEGRPPGSCLRWRPSAELEAHARYRVGPSSVRDERGRASVLPADPAWFETGAGRDEEAPVLEVHGWSRAHCLHLGVFASEPLEARWTLGSNELQASVVGWFEWGALVGPEVGESEWSLEVFDAAGNRGASSGVLPVDTIAAPGLVITEVLANPLGSEPKAEFVELASTSDEIQTTAGLFLADRSWEEVRAELELGGTPPGDPLGELTLDPYEVILVVADGFPGESEAEDQPVPEGVRTVTIGSSIGDGGLKNVGEPLVLYRAEPPQLLSSYGNWIATDASDFGGVSVERISTLACDGPGDWRANLALGATPGRLP